MLEWIVGIGFFGYFAYAIAREHKRPRRRQIHCTIDFVDHEDSIDLVVCNAYGVEITASFDWKQIRGLKARSELPPIVVIPGWQTVCVASFAKISSNPIYSVDWKWVWGSALASHSADAVYRLPYEEGEAFQVSQGPGGQFTHKGESFHAVDFDMPIGTPVLAARAGIVADVESDFRSKALSTEAGGNYVLIQHEDDTVAEYFHLKVDGVKVSPGTYVEVGDLLGYSGDTGCSSGPHLHLMVFRAVDGTRRESLSMKFLHADARKAETLQTGKFYRF